MARVSEVESDQGSLTYQYSLRVIEKNMRDAGLTLMCV